MQTTNCSNEMETIVDMPDIQKWGKDMRKL